MTFSWHGYESVRQCLRLMSSSYEDSTPSPPPRSHEFRRDVVANILHGVTILAYCAVAAFMNSIDSSDDTAPHVDVTG